MLHDPGYTVLEQGENRTKGQVRRMEYRIESKTGNAGNWLNAFGKKAADLLALLRETVAAGPEEEIQACEQAELEAETAAMFREVF